MGRREVAEVVESLLSERGGFSSAELSERTGLTRQALHRHLSSWVLEGRLQRQGRARATRYLPGPGNSSCPPESRPRGRAPAGLGRTYRVEGLSPQAAWRDLQAWLGSQAPGIGDTALAVLEWVTCELVANGLAHAQSPYLSLRAHADSDRVALALADAGLGAFETLRRKLGASSALDALQWLSNPPATPAAGPPDPACRGLRSVSHMVELFELDANGFEWSVDNALGETAVSEVPEVPRHSSGTGETGGAGTEVRVSVALDTQTHPADILAHRPAIHGTRVLALRDFGRRLFTRSDARRLLEGMDLYAEIVLDFDGIEGTGLGFVDELLRVWPIRHPLTRLRVQGAGAAVAFMLRQCGVKGD